MTTIEVVAVVLVTIGMAAAILLVIVGELAAAGAVHMYRCPSCKHLGLTSESAVPSSCSICRHPRLVHPLHHAARVGTGNQAPGANV